MGRLSGADAATNVLLVGGLALVAAGLGLAWLPLGIIAAGLGLVALAVLIGAGR